MLKYLRDKKTGLISWFIIGGIIITFTLWGYFKQGTSGNEIAATVNDEVILVDTFLKEYKEFYRRYQSLLKDKFNDDLARIYNLKAIALDSLINTKLAVQTAKKNGIIVTNQDVANSIRSNSVFNDSNGKFDMNLYQRILRANRFTQKDFENLVREQLYTQKLSNFISSAVKLSPYELQKQFISENDKVALNYLKLDPGALKAPVTKIEISNFIKENSEKISKYYDDNIIKYQKEEEVQASHILIKTENNDTDTVQNAKTKIEEIAKLVNPKNFKEMAKKYSQDSSAAQGGELGRFNKKAMVSEFSQIAFTQKPQTVSQPIKTKFGWHLIFVENKFPASKQSLQSVETEIANELVLEKKNKELASQKARELVESLKDPVKLNKLISELNLKWEKTSSFKFGSYINEIGKSEEVISAAFKLKQKGEFIPRFFLINNNYFFFKLLQRDIPELTEFDKQLTSLTDDLSRKKERMLLEEWQNNVKKTAKIYKNPQVTDYENSKF